MLFIKQQNRKEVNEDVIQFSFFLFSFFFLFFQIELPFTFSCHSEESIPKCPALVNRHNLSPLQCENSFPCLSSLVLLFILFVFLYQSIEIDHVTEGQILKMNPDVLVNLISSLLSREGKSLANVGRVVTEEVSGKNALEFTPEKWVGLGFTQGASHDLAQYFQGKKTQGIFLLLPALHPILFYSFFF